MPTTLVKRLDQVAAAQHRQQRTHWARQELALFTDAELEALCELARTADAAKRLGQPVAWTAEELRVLDRLGAKHGVHRRW